MGRAKEDLKKALCILSLSEDVEQISVSKIVEKAGYSRTYFYQNFESKEDLIDKIIKEEALLYVSASHISGNPDTFAEKYREMSVNLLKHVFDNQEIYLAIINNKIAPNSHQLFYETAGESLFKKVKINFDSSLGIDPKIYCGIAIMEYMCYIKYWADHGFELSPEYLSDQIIAISLLHQIRSQEKSENKYTFDFY